MQVKVWNATANQAPELQAHGQSGHNAEDPQETIELNIEDIFEEVMNFSLQEI